MNLTKTLFTLFLFIFAFNNSIAQTRYCDIEIRDSYHTMAYGDTMDIYLTIKNNGPDTIKADDTIYIKFVNYPYYSVAMGDVIAPGDSIQYNNITAWSENLGPDIDTEIVCMYVDSFFSNDVIDSVHTNDSFCMFLIYLPPSTSVIESNINTNNGFNIYPIPAKNFINIENQNNLQIQSISLFDINGRKVKDFEATSQKLNIQELEVGMYWLKLKTEKGLHSFKVLKE